jgi:hypothetical protein
MGAQRELGQLDVVHDGERCTEPVRVHDGQVSPTAVAKLPRKEPFRSELILSELRGGRRLLRCGWDVPAMHPEELRRQMLHVLQQLGPLRGVAVVLR